MPIVLMLEIRQHSVVLQLLTAAASSEVRSGELRLQNFSPPYCSPQTTPMLLDQSSINENPIPLLSTTPPSAATMESFVSLQRGIVGQV